MKICFRESRDPLKAQRYTLNAIPYEELELISEGGFGYVWRARSKSVNYAIKRIICTSEESWEMAKKELSMLKRLPDHPNILQLLNHGEIRIDGRLCLCLVFELCETTLFDLCKKISDSEIIDYFKQVVDGVEMLHALDITHRDLKLENILVQGRTLKIGDFGSAATEQCDLSKLSKISLNSQEELFSRTTTMLYRPPEMTDVLTRQIVGLPVDIWQLGVILFALSFKELPFAENKIAIAQGLFEIPQNKLPFKIIQLIQRMLSKEPAMRPTAKEIKLTLYIDDDNDFGDFQ